MIEVTSTRSLPLSGKTALVTGGSRSIGALILQRLAADGAQVAFTYRGSHMKAQEVAVAIEQVGDRALAQAERQSVRFYSLSAAIMARRNAYYDHLESAQRGSLDITPWLLWFLDTLKEALEQALLRIDRVLMKATFWQRHATTVLNERQIKVLNRLLDTAGEEF